MKNLKDMVYKIGITLVFFLVAITILYKAESLERHIEDVKLEPSKNSIELNLGEGNTKEINYLNEVTIKIENRKISSNEKFVKVKVQKTFEDELLRANNSIFKSTVLFGKMAVKGLGLWIMENYKPEIFLSIIPSH